MLVPASDDSERGALARVERLERRIGVAGDEPSKNPTERSSVGAGVAESRSDSPSSTARVAPQARIETPAPAPEPAAAPVTTKAAGEVSLEQLRNAWPEILESLQKTKMSAWTVVYTAHAIALDGDVLTLGFVSQNDVDSFKQPAGSGEGVSEFLRRAIVEILGLRVKFIAKADPSASQKAAAQKAAATTSAAPTPAAVPEASIPAVAAPSVATAPTPPAAAVQATPAAQQPGAKDAAGWAVAEIPSSEPDPASRPDPKRAAKANPDPTPAGTEKTGTGKTGTEKARYGESVVRELLGASFIEEQESAPRVVPVPKDD